MKQMKQKKILLIDDDRDMSWLFSSVISDDGYEIMATARGAEGVLLAEKPEVGLVFLDLKLPDMDGMEVLRKIKKHHSSLPVIMITGYETVESAVEAMKSGAYDYVVKPLPLDRLKIIIRNALQVHRLTSKVEALEKRLQERITTSDIIGNSPPMKRLFDCLRRVGPYDITVLLYGETGSGKEMVAKAIHEESGRRHQPFVPIDCATLPESLVESELFGYEKGAFTGAERTRPGRFEMADGGSVFLDEITNIPRHIQAKLLRIVEKGELTRLGGKELIKVDVRMIYATNIDLKEAVSSGKFREDLYHRINVFPITLSPLRERNGDISLLMRFFLEKYNRQLNKKVKHFSPQVEELFQEYHWPGNVRELENVIKSALLMAGEEVLPEHLSFKIEKRVDKFTEKVLPDTPLRESISSLEKTIITKSLKENHLNRRKTAAALRIDYKTLLSKIKEYRLKEKLW